MRARRFVVPPPLAPVTLDPVDRSSGDRTVSPQSRVHAEQERPEPRDTLPENNMEI